MPAFFLGEFGDRHQTSKKANLGTGKKIGDIYEKNRTGCR